ncbi:MAG: hypothetical protein NTV49_07820 [Kiritimatiellaeota bacterium]|nr:hypothetical protein [Kiritimatiellota bacterium]
MPIAENETLSPPSAAPAQATPPAPTPSAPATPPQPPAPAAKPDAGNTSKKKQRPPPPPPKSEAEQLLDAENEAMDETCPRDFYSKTTVASALQRRLQEHGAIGVAETVIGKTLLTLGEIVLRHRQNIISDLPHPKYPNYGRVVQRVSAVVVDHWLPLLDQTSSLFMKLLRDFYAIKHLAKLAAAKPEANTPSPALPPAAGEEACRP